MAATWVIGILLELISTMSGTVGKQLIRFSAMQKQAGNHRKSRLALRGGLFLNTVFGPIVDLTAYAFAPQSLIAPFGGLDVVWNTLLAPFTLNEKLNLRRVCSIVLVFGGTLSTVFLGSHEEIKYTPAVLQELFIRWRVLIYLLCFLLWFAINYFWLMRKSPGSLLRGFSLGATAGTIAGNMFCVKATAELIKTTIAERSLTVWIHWLPYCTLIGAVFFAVSNVVFMTRGMKEYEALFMVTIYEGSMVVSNSLSACVVLSEMDGLPPWQVASYGACIVVIICGMAFLISGEKASAKASELEIDEETNSYGEFCDGDDEDQLLEMSSLPAGRIATAPLVLVKSTSLESDNDESDATSEELSEVDER